MPKALQPRKTAEVKSEDGEKEDGPELDPKIAAILAKKGVKRRQTRQNSESSKKAKVEEEP